MQLKSPWMACLPLRSHLLLPLAPAFRAKQSCTYSLAREFARVNRFRIRKQLGTYPWRGVLEYENREPHTGHEVVSVQPCSKAEAYGGMEPFWLELVHPLAGHYA